MKKKAAFVAAVVGIAIGASGFWAYQKFVASKGGQNILPT